MVVRFVDICGIVDYHYLFLSCVWVMSIHIERNSEIAIAAVKQNTSRSFPRSWLITGFVTRLTQPVSLVEQELPYPSGVPEFIPGFNWGSCYSIFSFICMFCWSLFVLLYFFFWPLCCLFFFDIRILITPLVSSNSS